jgi:hypothetical protein
MEQDLESRDIVTTPPCTNIAPDFAHHDGNPLHCPGARKHMLQQFQLIPANSQPHLTLQQ